MHDDALSSLCESRSMPAATVQRYATIALRLLPATARPWLLLVTRRTGRPGTTRCKKNFMKKNRGVRAAAVHRRLAPGFWPRDMTADAAQAARQKKAGR
ncbi:hypothetical protein, partial [Achromobacter sp. AGC39]